MEKNLAEGLVGTMKKQLPRGTARRVLKQANALLYRLDMKYISAVLFPDISKPARCPTSHTIETAKFQDHFHIYFDILPTGTVFNSDPASAQGGVIYTTKVYNSDIDKVITDAHWPQAQPEGQQWGETTKTTANLNYTDVDGNRASVQTGNLFKSVRPFESSASSAGCLIFFPKIINMPCLAQAMPYAIAEPFVPQLDHSSGLATQYNFHADADNVWYNQHKFAGNDGKLAFKMLPQSDSTHIADTFSEVRLIGATLRVQYIDTSDQETGAIAGAHVTDTKPTHLTEKVIEMSPNRTLVRPHEGLRLTWLPRDEMDFRFYGTDYGIVPASRVGEANNSSSIWKQDDLTLFEQVISPQDYYGINNTGSTLQYIRLPNAKISNTINNRDIQPTNMSEIIGMGQRAGDSHHNPEMLCFYWRGLKPGTEVFRIDVYRHFEGIPRQQLRDVMNPDKIGKSSQVSLEMVLDQNFTKGCGSHPILTQQELSQKNEIILDHMETAVENDPVLRSKLDHSAIVDSFMN